MNYASLGPIEIHFPAACETNDDLQAEFPQWDLGAIQEKTGIRQRFITADDECTSDLAVAAAEKLLTRHDIDRDSIDFVLLCTQTPDYLLPTTACLVQSRLGLPISTGALDINLGCSGFVYGLSVANGLIQSGAARRILLITADTYTKLVHHEDRSLRTIFGDAAAATLVEPSSRVTLSGFQFGSDGAGADMLFAKSNRVGRDSDLKPRSRWRWKSELYMDGPGLIDFTMEAIPSLIDDVLSKADWRKEDIKHFIFHQATKKMLDMLRDRLGVEQQRVPLSLQDQGNTVSCTIPIAINKLRAEGKLPPGCRSLLVGFGVGLSWAGCAWEA